MSTDRHGVITVLGMSAAIDRAEDVLDSLLQIFTEIHRANDMFFGGITGFESFTERAREGSELARLHGSLFALEECAGALRDQVEAYAHVVDYTSPEECANAPDPAYSDPALRHDSIADDDGQRSGRRWRSRHSADSAVRDRTVEGIGFGPSVADLG